MLLKEWDLPLTLSILSILSMSISIVEGKEGIQEIEVVKAEETKHIFPKSLLSATIQDGSIRERRACR